MRTKSLIWMAALLLVSATAASAQTDALPSKPIGSFDFGYRVGEITGDQARFQRYQDLRDGAFLEQFRFNRDQEGWRLEAGADHVGYRDQRYFANFNSRGTVKASFEWNQIPLFFSRDTRMIYSETSPGVFKVDDAIQQGIQNKTLTLPSVVPGIVGPSFDLRNRRDTANFNLVVSPTRDLDVKLKFSSVRREGTMPWGASFGFGFVNELPAPVDTRTNDVTAGVEWANQKGRLAVSYDGSFFTNSVQALIWDNPIRFTDQTYGSAYSPGDGTSQGRASLWPDQTAHTVSASGSLKMPAHSRFTGNIAVGTWKNDGALLPFTINTAIPPIHLERATAEAEARTVAANFNFTSRPTRFAWLNARYRYNDFDNRTPHFPVEEYVRLDQVIEEFDPNGLGKIGPEPFSIKHHTFAVDASFTPIAYTAFKVGYTRDQADRTFRIFEKTTDNVFRASIDTTGNQYVTFRTIYEHARRRGSGFDLEALIVAGQQPGLRHYDVADRDRDRVTALVVVTPMSQLGFNASISAGNDDYPNSEFGLLDNDNRVYSVGVDVVPSEQVSVGLVYGYEKYSAASLSRSASPGPQFVDPTRNWRDDSTDKANTFNVSLDLLKAIPKTEVRFGYDYNRATSLYVFSGPLIPQLATFTPLPKVKNELQRGTMDFKYFVHKNVALGFVYWYDRYSVDDFAASSSTINAPYIPTGLLLGYVWRPYTAHTGWLRLTYLW